MLGYLIIISFECSHYNSEVLDLLKIFTVQGSLKALFQPLNQNITLGTFRYAKFKYDMSNVKETTNIVVFYMPQYGRYKYLF